MMTLLIAGMICGFCSSSPLGPINLWLIQSVLEKKPKATIFSFLSGVILADLTYAALAAWGQVAMLWLRELRKPLATAGGAFLLLLGITGIHRLRKAEDGRPLQPTGPGLSGQGGAFLGGVFLCGSNPAFLMFWLLVFQELPERTGILPDLAGIAFFLTGVALGDAVWFSLIIWLTTKGLSRFGQKVIKGIRLQVSLAFLALGLWFLAEGLS